VGQAFAQQGPAHHHSRAAACEARLCGAGSLPATEPRFGGTAICNFGRGSLSGNGSWDDSRVGEPKLPSQNGDVVHGWSLPGSEANQVSELRLHHRWQFQRLGLHPRAWHGTSSWALSWLLIGHRSPFRSQIGSHHPQCGAQTWNLPSSKAHILHSETLSNQANRTEPQFNQPDAASPHAANARDLGHLANPVWLFAPDGQSVTNGRSVPAAACCGS
jgi:hypothetical protein